MITVLVRTLNTLYTSVSTFRVFRGVIKFTVIYLVDHHSGERSTHLYTFSFTARGSQEQEDEPGRDRDLGNLAHTSRLGQTDEGSNLVLQTRHLSHPNVARLGVVRHFSHKVFVKLIGEIACVKTTLLNIVLSPQKLMPLVLNEINRYSVICLCC